MATDFSSLGLNARMQATTSWIARQKTTQGYDFDYGYEVQSRRIKTSTIAIQKLVKNANTAEAFGVWDTGDSLSALITLHPDDRVSKTLGVPIVNIWRANNFLEELAGNQIFPFAGGSVDAQDYSFWGGYWRDGSTNSNYYFQIFNNVSAGTAPWRLSATWEYIQENDLFSGVA